MLSVERFEKGLGVSMETFIQIITEGFYYKQDKNIYYKNNAIFIGNGYSPHSNHMVGTHFLNADYDPDTGKNLTDQHYWDWCKKEDVFCFEDYGKTWALTRQELEE